MVLKEKYIIWNVKIKKYIKRNMLVWKIKNKNKYVSEMEVIW